MLFWVLFVRDLHIEFKLILIYCFCELRANFIIIIYYLHESRFLSMILQVEA